VVKNRQLGRRRLNGRRSLSHESKGTLPPGGKSEGEGESNDYKRSIRSDEGKLPSRSSGIQAIWRGEGADIIGAVIW